MKEKSICINIYHVITEEISLKNRFFLLIYFVLISLLEILAYVVGGGLSFLAARVWLCTAVFLFITFCVSFIKWFYQDVKNKKYLLFGAYLGLLVFLLSFVGNLNYADINADAAQQLSAGLLAFSKYDWNYTGVAFLGYANRQYLLNALPAFLFGRSIVTLHLGFAVPFIIGLTMLFGEFRNWLIEQNMDENLALVPCYSIMAFRFIAEYYLNFEQAIIPVAMTMIGIALFLRLCRKIDVFTIIALTWVGCFYCDSYTPAIASLLLLLCFLVMYVLDIYRRNIKAKRLETKSLEYRNLYAKIQVLGGSIVTILCFFIATLLGKREDRLGSVREDANLVSLALESWGDFFGDKDAVFLGIFQGVVLLYMLLAIMFCLKIYDFVIAVWVLGVVLFANLLKGYTIYEKAWLMQRNMIIIPVLVTVIFLWIMRWLSKYKIQFCLKYLTILLLFLGLSIISNFCSEHQSFNYFRWIQPMKYMISCTEELLKLKGISDKSEFNLIVITDNLYQSNIYDYATFFYPNANAVSMSTGVNFSDIDTSRRTFVFAESADELLPFHIDVYSKTYENIRYKTQHTWYFGEIEAT